ncbi:MAG: hypothetical protein KDI64_02695 [Candidatus Accumulibacter sp.]|nr:hypothetical protein [Accumulibacter sp.]
METTFQALFRSFLPTFFPPNPRFVAPGSECRASCIASKIPCIAGFFSSDHSGTKNAFDGQVEAQSTATGGSSMRWPGVRRKKGRSMARSRTVNISTPVQVAMRIVAVANFSLGKA